MRDPIAYLAIDTCLSALTVAVKRDDGRVFCRVDEIGVGHAERIAPAFAAVMAEADLIPSQLRRMGVTVGPGSFMGQRVGLSFAKGLNVGLAIETVALTTLEAIAEGAGYPVTVVIDAKRGQVYAQSFSEDGRPLVPAQLVDHDAARALLKDAVRTAGSGVSVVDPSRNAEGHALPRPEALLRLTEQRHPSPLKTLYLRPPDAKRPTKAPL